MLARIRPLIRLLGQNNSLIASQVRCTLPGLSSSLVVYKNDFNCCNRNQQFSISSANYESHEYEVKAKGSSNSRGRTTESGLPVIDIEDHSSPTEFSLQLTDEEMKEVTNNYDEELVKKVKYIQLEHEVYRQEGFRVPQKIKVVRWKELIGMESRSQRKKLYEFMWLNEIKSVNDKRKKEEARKAKEEQFGPLLPLEAVADPTGMTYGLNKNTLFLRLYDSKVNQFNNHKIISAMQHSSPVVLDCGYDEFMTQREAQNCAYQIELMLQENRDHKESCNLVLCNAHRDSYVMKALLRRIPTLHQPEYPLNITEKSYLDLYSREKLVYLSPHARDELKEWSEDNIYIIGGMVDKSDPRPFSLAKAKKEGIPMAKFPLERYLDWGMGSKSLTLNQVLLIMLDLRNNGSDWMKAFQHIPRRKLKREFNFGNSNVPPSSPSARPPHASAGYPRKEKPSDVFEDYELILKSKKGFFPKTNLTSKY